ncbi:hypothetical protein ACS0TY_031875 [Phlomoides rotata]
MPNFIQESHGLRRHSPPQFLTRSQRTLFLFFLKCVIMLIVMSLFLFFLGFAAIVLLHFLFMSNTFHRRCTRILHPVAEASPDIQALIPEIAFRSTDFPGTSDCAICLDPFQEGDNCRNIPICKHLFHAKCVDRWIGKKPTCPVCRTPVDLDPQGLWSREDDQLKRLWSVDFEGTSY